MTRTLTIPESAPPAFHMLAKPTGAICNLDCAYCFFLDKEVFYPGSKFRMSDATLEQYIKQLIEAHQVDEVTVAWQGGEPTIMGLDFFRRAMALAEKYRRPGMRFQHTMQTNGTLLTEEWVAFFKEHNFLIGISLDGTPAAPTSTGWTRAAGLRSIKVMRERAALAGARYRVQRLDRGQPGQRRLPAGGLPLPARRSGRPGCSLSRWSSASTPTA
ncbi:MAG: radical SAM protein [Caldilineaceae bacterium]